MNMEYLEREPPAELAHYVERFWALKRPSMHQFERVLPLPYHHLVVNLSDEPYRVVSRAGMAVSEHYHGAFIVPIQLQSVVMQNPVELDNIGVVFKPYGLGAWSDLSLYEHASAIIDSGDVLHGSAALRDQLCAIDSLDSRLDRLVTFMAERLPSQPAIPSLVMQTLDEIAGDEPIAACAERHSVSHKHLIHQWQRYCGISPKQYRDIVRLSRVLGWFDNAQQPIRWSDVSSEFDFSDQPHFIRSFQKYCGMTPRRYAALLATYPSGTHAFVGLDDDYASE